MCEAECYVAAAFARDSPMTCTIDPANGPANNAKITERTTPQGPKKSSANATTDAVTQPATYHRCWSSARTATPVIMSVPMKAEANVKSPNMSPPTNNSGLKATRKINGPNIHAATKPMTPKPITLTTGPSSAWWMRFRFATNLTTNAD